MGMSLVSIGVFRYKNTSSMIDLNNQQLVITGNYNTYNVAYA